MPAVHTQEEPGLTAVLRAQWTESGKSLLELVDASPVLLVFLRHFGCSFCRQALDDVSKIRQQVEQQGIRPVFVHLGTPERAKPYFDYYDLADVERVSDPEATLYQRPVFGLGRMHPALHLLVPEVWKAWVQGAIRKHGIGLLREDADQMPGVFYLRDRAIVRAFRYRTIADQPNYLKLIH